MATSLHAWRARIAYGSPRGPWTAVASLLFFFNKKLRLKKGRQPLRLLNHSSTTLSREGLGLVSKVCDRREILEGLPHSRDCMA
jgi:hypothetical protein